MGCSEDFCVELLLGKMCDSEDVFCSTFGWEDAGF